MRKSTVALTIALLASTGAAIAFASLWRAERARNSGLTASLVPPTEAASPAISKTPALTPTSAEVQIGSAGVAAEVSVAAPITSEEDPRATERRLLRDPKYRAAWREQRRLNYAPRRENLVRVVGLTPAQAEAIIELQIDKQETWSDLDLPDSTPESQQRFEQHQLETERRYESRLPEILSAEKIARLRTYMESRPSRNMVDEFRNHLSGPDMLRDDQVEPLIEAIHVEQSQLVSDLEQNAVQAEAENNDPVAQRRFMELRNQFIAKSHARIHASAAVVLSRGQLQQLDAMLKRVRDRQDTADRMNQIQEKLDRDAHPSVSSN